MIELLAAIHHRENRDFPSDDFIKFWLHEMRTPELLITLASDYPAQAQELSKKRPLLTLAIDQDIEALRLAGYVLGNRLSLSLPQRKVAALLTQEIFNSSVMAAAWGTRLLAKISAEIREASVPPEGKQEGF